MFFISLVPILMRKASLQQFFLVASHAMPLFKLCVSFQGNQSENESTFVFCRAPFVKERLITQITAGGGTVFKRFDDLIEAKNECYLLTNGPCQTANYILCLANMIPTVTHDYIILCSKVRCFDIVVVEERTLVTCVITSGTALLYSLSFL